MPHAKKSRKKQQEQRLSPAEQGAVEKFAGAVRDSLGRLRPASEQIQELLGRWEQMTDGAPGLLGGSLITLVNEAVLGEQVERLRENISGRRRPAPSDLADHADFLGGLLGEYAALLKVLAGIELESGSPLAGDWEQVSDEVLKHGAALQQQAEQLELELEGDEEPEEASAPSAGMRPVARAFLRKVWEQLKEGVELEGEPARLAQVMEQHPEYRVAWESPEAISDRDYTIQGVNPFVHVTMHAVVENQIAEGEPPETAATLERLTAAGLPRHEAVHRIANAIVEQIWNMQRENRGFDRPAYIRALRKL